MNAENREELRNRMGQWIGSADFSVYISGYYKDWEAQQEQIINNFQRLAQTGRVEMGFVWMANPDFSSGPNDVGVGLLVAAGDGNEASEARAQAAYEQMGSQDYSGVDSATENQIEGLLADEDFQLFRVRALPESFTPQGPVYLFDAVLTKDMAKTEDGEMMPLVPCLVDPSAPAPILPIPRQIMAGGTPPNQITSFFDSFASDPLGATMVRERVLSISPMIQGVQGKTREECFEIIQQQLTHGDSRAAYVVSTTPLLVAAYADELDCVAILDFPVELVRRYNLEPGTRLLTVNGYLDSSDQVAPDLKLGPAQHHRWGNFHPIIAEFVSDDFEKINTRKEGIAEEEWGRCWELATAYRREFPNRTRNSDPLQSSNPWEPEGAGGGGCLDSLLRGFLKVVLIGLVLSMAISWIPSEDTSSVGSSTANPPIDDPLGLALEAPETKATPPAAPPKDNWSNLRPYPTGNNWDALAIADLVKADLITQHPIYWGKKITCSAACVLDEEECTMIVQLEGSVPPKTVDRAWEALQRALRLRLPESNKVVSLAVIHQPGFLGGRTTSPESDSSEALSSSDFDAFRSVYESLPELFDSEELPDTEQAWVKQWKPGTITKGRNYLVYPPDPGSRWYSWQNTDGTWRRAKFAREIQTENGPVAMLWNNPSSVGLVLYTDLTPTSANQAAQLAKGELPPEEAEPAIYTATVEDGQFTANLIENRAKRIWTTVSGNQQTAQLLGFGTHEGDPALWLYLSDSKIVMVKKGDLGQADLDYISRVESGEEP